MDYYLDNSNAYNRLAEEFVKYGKLIIAVDYDDTLYDFHNKGRTYNMLRSLLLRWRPYAQIIIFTGSGEDEYPAIERYLHENFIPYDGINCDSVVRSSSRKIYANVYLDDRAGLDSAYEMMLNLITEIEKGACITYDF